VAQYRIVFFNGIVCMFFIPAAIGWTNSHLHEIRAGGVGLGSDLPRLGVRA
jgi:hypothetical protein